MKKTVKGESRKGKRRNGSARVPSSVKELTGFDAMLRNGIAHLGDDRWSATIVFSDINYQLASEDRQLGILDAWAKLLNGLDTGTTAQIGVYTRTRGLDDLLADVTMPHHGDWLDEWRDDYNRNVRTMLESASRDADAVKTLTLTISEPDRDTAVATLNAICNTVTAQINAIDRACRATRLDRAGRLRLLAELLRPQDPFTFDERRWGRLPGRPDVRDLVCPWSIDARDSTRLEVTYGDDRTYYHRVLWVSSLPPELSDQLVNDLISLRVRTNVSIHLAPHDRGDSLTMVRRKHAEVKMQVMETQRRNRKQKLDPDDLPEDLADQQAQVGQLLGELRDTNQRLVSTLIAIGVTADSPEALDLACKRVKERVNRQACKAESMRYMQLEGLAAELPLGDNRLPMRHTLTTNTASILVPFAAHEIYEPGGILYGTNARTGNPVLADRRSHLNGNGLDLGMSGGGKSFFVKQEIASLLLNRDDEIIVIDPEREYQVLAREFGGEIIPISAGSNRCINPLDIVLDGTGEDDPIMAKTNQVVSLLGGLLGGVTGLSGPARSLIDRCAMSLYRKYRADGANPAMQPTLGDLHAMLEATGEPEGHELALALEAYTSGSLSGFNGQTNVDLTRRLTVFDVSGLTGELRTFGMMTIITQIWNRVMANREAGRRTWLYVDEFHRFLANRYSSSQFLDLYQRARKYGLGVTGITQNIEEILEFKDARKMFSNCDFLALLTQSENDANALAELLGLSDELRQCFEGVLQGQGLMKIGNAFIPFDGRISPDSRLYSLFNTKFDGSQKRDDDE